MFLVGQFISNITFFQREELSIAFYARRVIHSVFFDIATYGALDVFEEDGAEHDFAKNFCFFPHTCNITSIKYVVEHLRVCQLYCQQ